MNRNQDDRAQTLLDAMGEIDDAYLDEALGSLASPKKAKLLPLHQRPVFKLVAGAAALAAALGLVFTGAIGHLLGIGRNDNAEEAAPGIMESADPNTLSTLNRLLQGCTQSDLFTPTSSENLHFFDGTVRLTVRNEADGTLFVSRPLTPMEQEQLVLELKTTGTPVNNSGASAESTSPDSPQDPASRENYSVWVTLGDGQVVTPCLSVSGGNVGAGVLFDYEAERLPSQVFFDLLKAML